MSAASSAASSASASAVILSLAHFFLMTFMFLCILQSLVPASVLKVTVFSLMLCTREDVTLYFPRVRISILSPRFMVVPALSLALKFPFGLLPTAFSCFEIDLALVCPSSISNTNASSLLYATRRSSSTICFSFLGLFVEFRFSMMSGCVEDDEFFFQSNVETTRF